MGTPIRVLEPKELFIILQVRKLRLKVEIDCKIKACWLEGPSPNSAQCSFHSFSQCTQSKQQRVGNRRVSMQTTIRLWETGLQGDLLRRPTYPLWVVFFFLIFREQNNSFDWDICELWYKDHERGIWTLRPNTCDLVQKKKKREREMESKQSVLFSQVLRQYGVVESTRLSK